MDPIQRLNQDAAAIIGIDPSKPLPDFCADWDSVWDLIRYANTQRTEFSLFVMLYDRTPIYMCSFIKGMSQRTSTGDDPMIATVRAFIMMFTPSDEPYH